MGLILQKQCAGNWVFVQTLTPIPAADRAAYLVATYGKRAAQFRIVQDGPRPTAAQDRAAIAAFIRETGPMRPQPSAASLILAKLNRDPTPA